jgi:hypothetical protein
MTGQFERVVGRKSMGKERFLDDPFRCDQCGETSAFVWYADASTDDWHINMLSLCDTCILALADEVRAAKAGGASEQSAEVVVGGAAEEPLNAVEGFRYHDIGAIIAAEHKRHFPGPAKKDVSP